MAARRHWRFVVRDQYGYVIQNARVSVYQPGTSNAFVGTAYNAASGGSTVTNPFTTNSQGEVEAWFDTAQVVDVEVTDNSNTAYRAVGGVLDIADFTTFTEKDDIYVSASDQYPDKTAVPNAHGATEHTNIQRTLYLPAAIGTPQVGALASLGTYPNIIRVTTLADAVNTNGMFWHFQVPDDWDSGALSIQPIWVPGSTDGTAHTVRWQYDTKEIIAGTDVTAAGTTVTWTGESATRTANQAVIDTLTSTTLTPTAAGRIIRFAITRLGSDGADTYVGVVNLAGVVVSYTANQ